MRDFISGFCGDILRQRKKGKSSFTAARLFKSFFIFIFRLYDIDVWMMYKQKYKNASIDINVKVYGHVWISGSNIH